LPVAIKAIHDAAIMVDVEELIANTGSVGCPPLVVKGANVVPPEYVENEAPAAFANSGALAWQ